MYSPYMCNSVVPLSIGTAAAGTAAAGAHTCIAACTGCSLFSVCRNTSRHHCVSLIGIFFPVTSGMTFITISTTVINATISVDTALMLGFTRLLMV